MIQLLAAPLAAAALASPAGLVGNSGTLWAGPQAAVSVSVAVPSSYAGRPHVCARNNGPDPIRVVVLRVTDATHSTSTRGRYVRRHGSQCFTGSRIRVSGAYVTASAVDQATGAYGSTTVSVSTRLDPVRPVSIVAAVQLAVGVTPDGDWGRVTDAAVSRVRRAAHGRYGVMPGTVAALQNAFGIRADGDWGPVTDDAWMLARNAAAFRY